MTKFSSIGQVPKEKKVTVFKRSVTSVSIEDALKAPYDWENVQWIGTDACYGDVFKAWNDNTGFCIYFGTKGDEFND